MKDMKTDSPVYILHALHVLHGKIKGSKIKLIGSVFRHPNLILGFKKIHSCFIFPGQNRSPCQ